VRLINLLGAKFREIPIADACDRHFRDIGHDKRQDTAFENAQARERTQILLDIANMENGIVVGTGDFTELALGFATYNGDHMSNYCVNGNVPKTVIKELIRWICKQHFCITENCSAISCNTNHPEDARARDRETLPLFPSEQSKEIGEILEDIISTPISPELLPPDASGGISQKTEEIVGSYELNDFFLYYVLKYAFPPSKILFMAEQAFCGKYEKAELKQRLKAFYRRFITQQFKRSCMPDGPAVYDFGFSPRNGYLIPCDACFDVWLKTLD
jgi:NAD+ synthase (glutamine-hydrolysing)